MTDARARAEERTQLFRDLLKGKTPKRVPYSTAPAMEYVIQYAGYDLEKTLWTLKDLDKIYDKFCAEFLSDTNPVGTYRLPTFYQILGSKAFVMGSGGFMQHPEVVGLLPEEYDEFIASPYDCILNTILPRLYTALDAEPSQKALVLAKAYRAYLDDFGVIAAVRNKMHEKYGYAMLAAGFTIAPFDFIADFPRSFSGISIDIRRRPEKVLEACEAVTPLLVKKGKLPPSVEYGYIMIPLHMAPYMREKDFEKFYWPTFKKLVEELSANGHNCYLFIEQDWMRYLDYLNDLPENTIMRFEFGDPKLVKEKVGKKHIVSGLYPITLLQTGTKEQCVDKAKELMDILAPGGKYWFNYDKSVLTIDKEGRIADNLKAVTEYVYENGKY
ncbi:MAG: uroporphyrinogen decarboxylase [Firmicutes bacterium]|nr:uroporphyrinogen decarboxylase [Bacillota bacterium]